jgi:hypothetical protein
MRISNNLQVDEADEIIYDVANLNQSFFGTFKKQLTSALKIQLALYHLKIFIEIY